MAASGAIGHVDVRQMAEEILPKSIQMAPTVTFPGRHPQEVSKPRGFDRDLEVRPSHKF